MVVLCVLVDKLDMIDGTEKGRHDLRVWVWEYRAAKI